MTYFDQAIRFTLQEEGGLVNDSADKGGLTNYGITQALFNRHLEIMRQSERSVATITAAEARSIALAEFWIPARAELFRWPVSAVHFDNSYIMGIRHATSLLQAVVGGEIDGVLGPRTLDRANEELPSRLGFSMIDARRGYHLKATIDDTTQARFLAGWLARCKALERFVANPGGDE